MSSINNIKYRKDIDGLRGLAIIVVLLFHYKFDIFQGGFIGVDIFFVISGFLITSFINKSIADKQFTFSNFYIRRARRLIPSYIIVLVFCLIASYFLLPPREFIHFNKVLSYALVFASNIFFLGDTDYFGIHSQFKPLLHTWSLGVEAQFYLIWPAMLLVLLKIKTVGRYLLTALIFTGSIWLAILFDEKVSAYYFPIFRFYEFMLGSIIFFASGRVIKYGFLSSLLFILGFCCIVISVFQYDSQLLFPSYFALLPCVGTALIIYTYPGCSLKLKWLINNPLFIRAGLISYPLYLVHWPLLVFYQYMVFRPISFSDKLLLILLSVLISWVLYRYLEIPIRNKTRIKDKTITFNSFLIKQVFIIILTIYIFVMPALAYKALEADGWGWRLESIHTEKLAIQLKNSTAKQALHIENYRRSIKNSNKISSHHILVIGDSHGADVFGALTLNYPATQRNIFHRVNSLSECFASSNSVEKINHNKFFSNQIVNAKSKKCQEAKKKIYFLINSYPEAIALVVLAWNKSPLMTYSSSVELLKELSVSNIVIFGENKLPFDPVPYIVAKGPELKSNELLYKLGEKKRLEFSHSIRNAANQLEVDFYDIFSTVCDDKKKRCEVLNSAGELLYRDDNHWTFEGWKYYGGFMSKLLLKYD